MNIEAINLRRREVIWSGGQVSRIASMFDCDGDQTDEADEAVCVVCPTPSGQWANIVVSDFEPTVTH